MSWIFNFVFVILLALKLLELTTASWIDVFTPLLFSFATHVITLMVANANTKRVVRAFDKHEW
ncbi:hypothetical protein [Lysinibacillus sp. NPDC086135]|uniref:hypothetical protein n=1 Tax=Lysinibacillus sp. NPDC086135 TaxID=3364130 RepID=UPI0037FB59A0